MQACQKHWDMLRNEVEAQGMYHLVSGNSEIASMKLAGELAGETAGKEESKDTFDPLMRCWFMIMNRTLEIAGVAALHAEFGCPICRFNEARTEDGRCKCNDPNCKAKEPGSVPDHETWLVGPDSCVASVREMCVERGWL